MRQNDAPGRDPLGPPPRHDDVGAFFLDAKPNAAYVRPTMFLQKNQPAPWLMLCLLAILPNILGCTVYSYGYASQRTPPPTPAFVPAVATPIPPPPRPWSHPSLARHAAPVPTRHPPRAVPAYTPSARTPPPHRLPPSRYGAPSERRPAPSAGTGARIRIDIRASPERTPSRTPNRRGRR